MFDFCFAATVTRRAFSRPRLVMIRPFVMRAGADACGAKNNAGCYLGNFEFYRLVICCY